MADNLKLQNYFSHDSNARNDSKILNLRISLGAEGYGIFFMLLERLRDEANYMSVTDYNAIAFDLRVDASKVKKVVEDFGLFVFTENGEYFYSESFNRRMAIKDEKNKKRIEAGKLGAKKRWEKNGNAIEKNGNAIAMLQKNIARKEKERKEKESKERELYIKNNLALFNNVLKHKITLQTLSKIAEKYDLDLFLEKIKESTWIRENIDLNKASDDFLLKISKGDYKTYKTKNKNSFHNFQGITDSYTSDELEDVARKKREEAYEKYDLR